MTAGNRRLGSLQNSLMDLSSPLDRQLVGTGGGGTPPPTHIRTTSRQGSGRTSGGGDGRTPTQSRHAPTNTELELLVDLAEMDGKVADPPHIAARATRWASLPAGESREGAALFGGAVGVPPPTHIRTASRQGSGRTSRGGDGRTPTRSRGASTNLGIRAGGKKPKGLLTLPTVQIQSRRARWHESVIWSPTCPGTSS